ncbi:MAG: 3-isopropylmalate dehydratase, partial [Chloroflexota bacterium]|nr:3-isopropylmalate dehydratase [Chloroflexota bacterium]
EPFEPAFPDDDAQYEAVHEVDVTALAPQVVLPGKVPGNSRDVDELAGTKIDQAFIGSCANGRFEDLATAAEIVKGRHVAAGTRFIVTPGSTDVYRRALRAGIIQVLAEAGAIVTASTCGACFGGHMGVLAPGERCITASTRNFKGRMGSPEADVFLASPSTVAASALAGAIADPRRV